LAEDTIHLRAVTSDFWVLVVAASGAGSAAAAIADEANEVANKGANKEANKEADPVANNEANIEVDNQPIKKTALGKRNDMAEIKAEERSERP